MARLALAPIALAACAAVVAAEEATGCRGATCAPIGELVEGSVSLLQHATAAQRAAGSGAAGSAIAATAAAEARGSEGAGAQNPVLLPLQGRDGEQIAESPLWPFKVKDTEQAQRTEKTCLKAYQTAFDCHYIPPAFGGALCGCLGDHAAVWNCPGWYGYMMTGSWLVRPNNSYTVVPLDKFSDASYFLEKTNETRTTCFNAFQQAYDCTFIAMDEGGAKGMCALDYCPTWFDECLGGYGKIAAVYRDSVN